MERRKHSRVNLRHPVACTCHVEDGEVLHGFVKNIGLMGIMVEVPDLEDRLLIECCQHVHVYETADTVPAMFDDLTGTLNWVYKNYLGIGFDLPIRSSHEELLSWLDSLDQLGEDVA